MSEITMSQNVEIENPKLRNVATRVARELELAIDKVAANAKDAAKYPLAADPKSAERILSSRFKNLPAAKRQAAGEQALLRINAAAALRDKHFAELAGVSLSNPAGVDVAARAVPLPASQKFTPAELDALLAVAPVPVPAGTPPMNRLQFRVHKVKCVDETGSSGWWLFPGGEDLGDDEIDLGAVTTDESGDTKKVSSFRVGSQFDDGEAVVFSPPRILSTFDLTEGTAWPKSYFVTLILAEIDNGGMPDFLNQLTSWLKAKVKEKLIEAGIPAGLSGGPIAAILVVVVSAVVDFVFDYLRNVWNDDEFSPVTAQVTLPSASQRWPGGLTDSPQSVATFKGHGGHYRLAYDWRLVTSTAAEM